MVLRTSLLLAAAALVAACAQSAPAPARSAHARLGAAEVEAVDRGPTSYEAEIGGLSQYDVEQQLQALFPRLTDCVRRATDRASFIGGRVSLRMRVDRSGNVRWAYLSDSTLGDRDAELCVLGIVKNRTWPKPLSGEGLAETSFDVEPAEAPRPLPSYKSSLLAQRASAATRRCRKGIHGGFRATAYVGPKGEVLTAGVAPPDEHGEEASDCIVEALMGLRVGNLVADRGAAAKASFEIP
jgi:hypothetical protein